MKNYFINTKDGHWQLKKEHAKRATLVADTKAEIKKKTQDFVREKNGISVKTQRVDGTFHDESTFQRKDDPRKSKG